MADSCGGYRAADGHRGPARFRPWSSRAKRGRKPLSVILFRRPPRRPGPEMPSGELQLQEPPELPENQGGMSSMVGYAPMALGSLSMMLVFLRPGSGGGALTYVALGLMAVSAVGMVVSQMIRGSGERKRRIRNERRDYLRYLSSVRRQVRKAIGAQREAQAWQHPDPPALWSVARTSRLWERRPTHPDFGEVRIGRGRAAAGAGAVAADHQAGRGPRTAQRARAAPVHPGLRRGARPAGRRLSAGLLAGGLPGRPGGAYGPWPGRCCARRPPSTRRRTCGSPWCTEHDSRPGWEWVKWLPHALHPAETDGAGAIRLVTDSAASWSSYWAPTSRAGRPSIRRRSRPGTSRTRW